MGPLTSTGVADSTVLLGNASLATSQDSAAAGIAEAFPYTAAASGNARSISAYVDSGSTAAALVVGLYADDDGRPGTLLATGSVALPSPGQWNPATLSSTPAVSGGSGYWIAVLATGGTLSFRDLNPGAGSCSETSHRHNLTALPSRWTGGVTQATCSMSAYVSGLSAPVNRTLPSIVGQAVQGQTLTATAGSWTGSSSDAYQWQDCDSSGANCADIRGATASGYTLTSGDVGDTIRVVVTASNTLGSTSTASMTTAVVTPVGALTASFTYSPGAPVTGQVVYFDASASTCTNAPCSYTWADNPPGGGTFPLGSGQTMSFTFTGPGTKYVTLTVTDASTNSTSVEHDVVVGTAAPTNTGLPTVSGQTMPGQTLTTSNGSWSGGTPMTFTYQWRHCATSCTDISGATAAAYAVQSSDVGDTIAVSVSATNAYGSASASSVQTALVTPSIPSGGLLCGSQGGPYLQASWPSGNWVPFSCSSPWNSQLPAYASATLDPLNWIEMSYIAANWGSPFTPWSVSNTPSNDTSSGWGHPLYWAKSSDPTYTINDTGYACGAPASTSCPATMQIPNGAWHATGSDGHLAVIQPDGHTEIDAWQVQNANPIQGGGTITVHGYGALDLDGAGCCGGSTAANQGLPAGAIRGPELAAGVIKHALSVVVPCTSGLYVAPASGAALGGCPSAPADGARFQLRMSDTTINGLSIPAYQKIILKAMAHYGIYITDTGGNMSQTDLQYEPAIQYTSFGNTSNTVMSYLQTQGYSDPTSIALNLPWSDFQVVSSCYAAGTC